MISWQDTTGDVRPGHLRELSARMALGDAVVLAYWARPCFRVFLDREAQERVYSHVTTSRDELGGLLIGRVFEDSPPFERGGATVVAVLETIASEEFSSSSVSLRMEARLWDRVHKHLSRDLMVVGWYHSHPNLGAFFSGTDRRTQSAFFRHSYSVGWVVDPIRKEEKWFQGPESQQLTTAQTRLGPFRAWFDFSASEH